MENFKGLQHEKSKFTDFLKNAGIGVIFDFKHDLKGLKF